MIPYFEGARLCSLCHKWEIPVEPKPIYVPDKRCYNQYSKKYCYVIDTIAQEMEIHPKISGVDDVECRTVVRELKAKNLIILKENSPVDSLNYHDYIVSFDFAWNEKTAEQKTEIIINLLKLGAEAIKLTATVISIANK